MQPGVQEWIGGDWYVMPQEPRAGAYRGLLRRVRTRTWGGCDFVDGEEARYPEIPALEIEEALAPLREAPLDADQCRAAAASWRPRPGYLGSGPPRCRAQERWLVTALATGSEVEVSGFWYPMFEAGSYQGFQVWGLYAERITLLRGPQVGARG